MRKIVVLNQKGGVGKTTTVANLGACLAERDRRVLMLDVDPQSNLTIHFGIEPDRQMPSLYGVLRGEHGLEQAIRATGLAGLSIVPASIDLAGLSVELADRPGRLMLLRQALQALPDGFDYVLMDSPPSLGLLTVNAMCAAEEVFIPLQTEFFALQGVSKLLRSVRLVRKGLNRELRISGVIASMYDGRTCLAQEILDNMRKHFGSRVFKTVIRKNVRLAEAPGFGLAIVQYDATCHGAQDYRALAEEVIAMERPAREASDSAGYETAEPRLMKS